MQLCTTASANFDFTKLELNSSGKKRWTWPIIPHVAVLGIFLMCFHSCISLGMVKKGIKRAPKG